MWAETRTVLRAVAADFFFNCWYLEIPSDNRIRHIPRCVHYMRKAFDWKRSRISMLEVEALPLELYSVSPDWLEYCFIYEKFVTCREYFRPSNQYILVRVIPSCFRFAKKCLCQPSLLSRRSPRYLTSSSWGNCPLFIWTGGHVSLLVVNVTWIDLNSLAFIHHFLNQSWIASRSVCSFCEAMAGSLSMATTAVKHVHANSAKHIPSFAWRETYSCQ
jgi:hypothetical protein